MGSRESLFYLPFFLVVYFLGKCSVFGPQSYPSLDSSSFWFFSLCDDTRKRREKKPPPRQILQTTFPSFFQAMACCDSDEYDDHEEPRKQPGRIVRAARGLERCCCGVLKYTPLVFVYGLTSWATWAVVTISRAPGLSVWLGEFVTLKSRCPGQGCCRGLQWLKLGR